MSSAVMNETDAGTSVTGWIRSDAPTTRPASIRISSSRLRSESACARATVGTTSRTRTKSLEGLPNRIGIILDKRGKRKEFRAELETGALRVLEVDSEADSAALDVELRHSADLRKPLHVAHRQHGSHVETGQDL